MVLRKGDTTSRSDFGRKQKIQVKGGSAPVASPAGGSSENYPKVKRRKSPYPVNPVPAVSRLRIAGTSSSSDCEDESKIPNKMKIKTCQTPNKKADSGIETSQSQKGTESNFLISVFDRLPERWKNWIVRGVFGLLMVAGFSFIIYLGPVALVVLTLSIQVRCFAEVINIGYTIYKVASFPWFRFRSLSWYFLITSNYFFYMETSLGVGIARSVSALSSNSNSNQHSMYKTDDNNNIDNNISDNNLYFKTEENPCSSRLVNSISNHGAFQFLTSYNRFISFWLYMIGFLWFFVSLSLAKKSKKYRGVQIESNQYNLFAFTHVSLLIVVAQSYLIIQNIFEGMIWFIVPVSMIVCNDAMAYFFGFFMGRTPLIKLSPKKTWEGYVGGGFATVILGIFASHWICQYPFFTCPVEYTDSVLGMMPNSNCEVIYLFSLQDYAIPGFLVNLGMSPSLKTYPFVLHSLALSIFSSVIGPFGGFFASGFKRAFKIKDFAAVIPGHGGVLDRFDCQFLMATFVNVYITSFIRQPSPERLLQQALDLKPEAQLDLLNSLGNHLVKNGLL